MYGMYGDINRENANKIAPPLSPIVQCSNFRSQITQIYSIVVCEIYYESLLKMEQLSDAKLSEAYTERMEHYVS